MFGQRLLVLMGNLECYFREFHAMSYLNHSVKTIIIIFPLLRNCFVNVSHSNYYYKSLLKTFKNENGCRDDKSKK